MNNKKNIRKRSVKLDPILLRFMAISWHLPSSKKSNCHVLATAWCACAHKAKNHSTLEKLHTKKKRKKEKKRKKKKKREMERPKKKKKKSQGTCSCSFALEWFYKHKFQIWQDCQNLVKHFFLRYKMNATHKFSIVYIVLENSKSLNSSKNYCSLGFK